MVPVHIAYLITRMDTVGGAQIHVRDLALGMLKAGHEVSLLSGSSGPLSTALEAAGIRVRIIPSLKRAIAPWQDLTTLRELVGILRQLKPTLLAVHSSKAGWLGRLAGRRLRLPTVYTVHGWVFSGELVRLHPWLYLGLEKLISPWTQALITVSTQDRSLAERYGLGRSERTWMIHNGLPDVDNILRAKPAESPPHLIMVARFQRPKHHVPLLKSLAALTHLPWSMEFVGDGPLRPQIETLVHQLGLEQRVAFSGTCWNVAERLARAQIGLLISQREGLPLSIIEGMRAGLPIVASDVGGIKELVVDGGTGFLIPPSDDGNLLRHRLQALLEEPQLRQRMGDAGRLGYEQGFSFKQMLELTQAVYEKLVLTAGPKEGR